jgi:hypothetical protein
MSLLEEAGGPSEEFPVNPQLKEAEKDTEKVYDVVKDNVPKGIPGSSEVKEVINDVETLQRKTLNEGPVAEVSGIITQDLQNPEPCKNIVECLHVITISGIVFMLTILVYMNKYLDQRLTIKDETIKKEDFNGNMSPVAMSACPGGMCSALCMASYFCCCCLRMETFGKLEKWDRSTKMQRILIFACIMFFGHVGCVFLAILLKLPPTYVHIAGVASTAIFPLGMIFLGYLMADKRVDLKNKQNSGEKISYGTEIAVSAFCTPCVTGQEVVFMEQYKDHFKDAEW